MYHPSMTLPVAAWEGRVAEPMVQNRELADGCLYGKKLDSETNETGIIRHDKANDDHDKLRIRRYHTKSQDYGTWNEAPPL